MGDQKNTRARQRTSQRQQERKRSASTKENRLQTVVDADLEAELDAEDDDGAGAAALLLNFQQSIQGSRSGVDDARAHQDRINAQVFAHNTAFMAKAPSFQSNARTKARSVSSSQSAKPQTTIQLDDSEEDDNDDDDDDDSGPFDVTYEVLVPGVNASAGFTLSSSTLFKKFEKSVANELGVNRRQIASLGYTLSIWPKTPKPVPKLVDSDERYEAMLQEVEDYEKAQEEKKKKKGNRGPKAIVRIVNLTPESGPDKKGKGASKASKGSTPAISGDVEQEVETKNMAALEKEYECVEHGGRPCWTKTETGEHYHLTVDDLTVWAMRMAKNTATIKTPPNALLKSMGEKAVKQSTIKAAQPGPNMYGAWGAMPPMPPMYPPWAPFPPVYPNMIAPFIPARASETPKPTKRNRPSSPAASSDSSPAQPPSKRSTYPLVSEWLVDLDTHLERGVDEQDYAQFALTFKNAGIVRLNDVANLKTVEQVQQVTGANLGIAMRLLEYALEDVAAVNKAQRKKKK